ncbi:MAG: DUF433 domain-containing protein [Planctomycetota bacterium]
MNKPYVEFRDGGYWITGTRISLDSIIYAFLQGQIAENIAQSFPLLTLEQVYGGITFYLAHRNEIDLYLKKAQSEFALFKEALYQSDSDFYLKLIQAKRQFQGSQ